MLKTLPFVLVLLLMFGCKREYARFQNSIQDNYLKPKKQNVASALKTGTVVPHELEEMAPMPAPAIENLTANSTQPLPTIKNEVNHKTDWLPKGLLKKKSKTDERQKPRLFQKPEKKGIFQKKKSKKRGGLSHKAFVRLEIIVFGLLSAFMIIRALRKLF
jgi:hypothetical protein